MPDLEQFVVEATAFAGMTPAQLAALAGTAENVRFRDGEYLFHEGGQADVFYLVREGDVALETFVPQRGPVVVETVHKAELVGASWLFPPYRWHLDGRAIGNVRAVVFDGAALRELSQEDHLFGYELLIRFAEPLIARLQAARVRLLDVYGHAGASS